MAYDAREGKGNGYHPEGDTIHGVAEGDHRLSTVGHHRPHHRGSGGRHARAEARDPDYTSPPPTSTADKKSVPAAPDTLPAVGEENGDARQDMGGGPPESPPAVQCQQDVTTSGHLAHGAPPPQERQGQGRYGSGIPEHC